MLASKPPPVSAEHIGCVDSVASADDGCLNKFVMLGLLGQSLVVDDPVGNVDELLIEQAVLGMGYIQCSFEPVYNGLVADIEHHFKDATVSGCIFDVLNGL